MKSLLVAGCRRALLAGAVFSLLPMAAHAGNATWDTNPTSSDWHTAANWTPAVVPNAPGEVATFGVSTITHVTFSAQVKIGSIVFTPGASSYTIDAGPNSFFLDGGMPVNDSGVTQNIIGTGLIYFDVDAGDSLNYATTGGLIDFYDFATGGTSTFLIDGGGEVLFQVQTSAGHGIYTVNDGVARFEEHASAGSGTFIVNEGSLDFVDTATGGTSRLELLGVSTMDLNGLVNTSFSVGSIEGSGTISLGSHRFTVGSNNLSTLFSGLIQDGTLAAGGSLAKAGTGQLTLSHANTYTGGTLIQGGTLLIKNKTGSATGTGAVLVQGGAIGGMGSMSGSLTLGSGSHPGLLAPGTGIKPGTVTTSDSLTFSSVGTYAVDLNTRARTNDRVAATGVTINAGAQITLNDVRPTPLPAGTVFTLIRNNAATPIAGTFTNLPDGSTITSGGNTYTASYAGGDGNDLILTSL